MSRHGQYSLQPYSMQRLIDGAQADALRASMEIASLARAQPLFTAGTVKAADINQEYRENDYQTTTRTA